MSDFGYTKEELKAALRFKDRRDIIDAILDEERTYSIEEAEEIIREFMEGCV